MQRLAIKMADEEISKPLVTRQKGEDGFCPEKSKTCKDKKLIECRGLNVRRGLKYLLFFCFEVYFWDPYCIQRLYYPDNINNPNTPDDDTKVSVVLMNFARPRNVQESKLMPVLTSHQSIDEIVLLHANPKTIFNYTHEKVRNVNATLEDKEMGLAIRFAFCSQVKTPYVIHLDDDIEFPPETINELMAEFQKNTKRIVGLAGRSQTLLNTGSDTNSYTILDAPYETEVVLTRLMIMETEICKQFVKYSPLLEDLASQGTGPKWNGEDIFMSLVANHVYEQEQRNQPGASHGQQQPHYNYAMPWLKHKNVEYIYPGSFEFDINGGIRGFHPFSADYWSKFFYLRKNLKFRGYFWKTAKKRLQELSEE